MDLPLSNNPAISFSFKTDNLHNELLRYIYNIISQDINPGWISNAPLDGYVISTVMPFEPDPSIVKQEAVRLPLLSLYRSQSTYDYISLATKRETCTWQGYYILPECKVQDRNRLKFVQSAVMKSIQSQLDVICHDSLFDIDLISSEMGFWSAASPDDDNIINPLISFIIETQEYEANRVDGYQGIPFLGADGYVSIFDAVDDDYKLIIEYEAYNDVI